MACSCSCFPAPRPVAGASAVRVPARLRPQAALRRHAVGQVAHSVVLDVSKARARGRTAARGTPDECISGAA